MPVGFDLPRTRQEALDIAMRWGVTLSHNNIMLEMEGFPNGGMEASRPHTLAMISVADAAEAQKWAAIAQALPDEPLDEPLTAGEIQALLWAVRNISSDALRQGPYRAVPEVCGHGDLSTGTNKIEKWLGKMLRPEEVT